MTAPGTSGAKSVQRGQVVFCHRPNSGQTDWTCGLVACHEALSTLGLELSITEVLKTYNEQGLRFHSFGTTVMHLSALLQAFDLKVMVSTSSRWLRELWVATSQGRKPLPIDPPESQEVLQCMERFTNNGGRLTFLENNKSPFSVVWDCVRSDGAAILCVSARSFYGINEDWNHFVTAFLKGGFRMQVIDRIDESAFGTKTLWKRSMEVASSFDWSTWKGDCVLAWRKKCVRNQKNISRSILLRKVGRAGRGNIV